MYLQLQDVKKSYGESGNRTEVLKGISFELERGKICVLLGPSGSGKSTLLNIIGGIETPDSGSVTIGGETMDYSKEKKLSKYRRNHLGCVFQSYNLIPNLTVRENIQLHIFFMSADSFLFSLPDPPSFARATASRYTTLPMKTTVRG